jgi:hypothetical protein
MQRPWLAALCLAILVASVTNIVLVLGAGHRSFIIEQFLAKRPSAGIHFFPMVYAVRTEKGWELCDTESESWDRLSRVLQDSPQRVVNLGRDVRIERTGIYALTGETRIQRLVVARMDTDPATPALTAADDAALRALYCDYLDSLSDDKTLSSQIRAGDVVQSRTLWPGVLHNFIALAALLGLATSLTGLPRWLRSLRRQPWQCRGCGYDLRGSDGAKCPECGRER